MSTRFVIVASCVLSVASPACSRAPAPTSVPSASAESVATPPLPAAQTSAPAVLASPSTDAGCRSAMFDDFPDVAGGTARMPRVKTTKQKPFTMTTELPTGRLGDPALDLAIRGAMTAYCAERERLFFADAKREKKDGRSAANFYDECACDPSYVSAKLASVACSNQESLAGAHPGWHYAGFTFALAGGAAKEVKLQDVCAPAAACTKRLTAVLLKLPDGPSTYDEATLSKYLAKPTFVLGETALRLLVDEDLSGYAAHGLSCDLPYAELGALSRLQPGAPTK